MTLLLLGLIVFLGTHSLRIVANDWVNRQIEKHGPLVWKGIYSVLSMIGFIGIVVGYGKAQLSHQYLWTPPVWASHLTGLLTLISFILLASMNKPKNILYAKVKHPMIIAIKIWACAHFLANGSLAATVLFGSFLLWAVFDFRSCRQRDQANTRLNQVSNVQASWLGTLPAIVIGTLAWASFAFYFHRVLIGVQPFMR